MREQSVSLNYYTNLTVKVELIGLLLIKCFSMLFLRSKEIKRHQS